MHRQNAGGGLRSKIAASLEPTATTQEAESPSAHHSKVGRRGSVVRTTSRFLATFAALVGILFILALTGIVADHLHGLSGLALAAGLFIAALMVAAREEGL